MLFFPTTQIASRLFFEQNISNPNVVLKHKVSVFSNDECKFSGGWGILTRPDWQTQKPLPHALRCGKRGGSLKFSFTGTGVALCGDWLQDGGTADIVLDGRPVRTIDTYYFYNGQEHDNMVLWNVHGLTPGRHSVLLTARGEKRKDSQGTYVSITQLLVFDTAPKKSLHYRFPFE